MKIVSKIHQTSIKNQWKWSPWGRAGATLGVFGVMLVESDRLWPYFGSNLGGLGRILAPRGRVLGDFGLQVGAQNRPKSIPRAIWNVINFLMDLKIDFWSDLIPSWLPNPSKNEAKLVPKSMQVGVLIWVLFFDWCGAVFHWSLDTRYHGRGHEFIGPANTKYICLFFLLLCCWDDLLIKF